MRPLPAILIALTSLTTGFTGGVLVGKLIDVPFVSKGYEWSIGIYTGPSPFDLTSPANLNPVLTSKHVTDVRARFVADPFMVSEKSVWYMFFEVMNADTMQGDIGLAVSSNGMEWTYKQIVLDEPFHLSYPYVFKWKGMYYMIPESYRASSVRLYRAYEFPTKWSLATTLLRGDFVDPSIVHYGDKWWIFVAHRQGNNVLRLFYSEALEGPYLEHPRSPIILGDSKRARPGGRVLILGKRVFRFAQDDYDSYGTQVRVFEIVALTATNYAERELDQSPILKASGSGWNAEGMHHVDPHQIGSDRWMASVDGLRRSLFFSMR